MLPWDHFPSGNRPKKPLTKEQMKKLQEQYARAEEVAEKVAKKESAEKTQIKEEAEEVLKTQFL